MNYGILSDNHSDNCSIHVEKDAISSAIISGNGNKVVIYQYQLERQVQEDKASSATEISSNPYKGLLAFQSEDAEQYFGREKQIEKLWNLFQTLHEDTTQAEAPLRLLPILGPSGSGKSSLARAGLIPEIARCPLSVKSQPRVVVLVPGTHPLEALATVLARVATNDQIPVAKTREFTEELQKTSKKTTYTTKNTIIYDGLRRIANTLPSIATSSLIVLVDQFEEVYSLCHDSRERQIFIENLINAAGDPSGYVSVIITVRSDFLGEIQRHSALNQVIAKQGVIVPAMTELELRRAITKPAENAGYSLDEATINLLLKDTEGREGALPLLQFALTRIWSGLEIGVQPAQTLNQMGGVGGALADEAQRIFENLNSDEKKIAQRVFLGLVQLGEGTRDTRRRCKISSLVSYRDEPEQVKKVINKFAHPGVRLITLSSLDGTETAEVTHEALFANWGQLKKWLDSSRNDIRFGRRLDEAARVWHENGHSQGSLWRPPDLDLLAKYYERAKDNMTPLQVEFFHAAVNAEELKKQAAIKAEKERKLQRQLLTNVLSTGLLLTTTALGFALYQWQRAEQQRMEQNATTAKLLLSTDPAQAMVAAINAVELSHSPLLSFPKRLEPASVKSILFSAVQSNREINLLKGHQGIVRSVAISTDGNIIISGGDDGTVRLWSREGKQISKPFKGHKGIVRSVAISTDSNVVVSGGDDGTVRLWTREGKPIGKPFQSHGGSVYSIAISTDNQTIISGGNDGTLHQWTRDGHLIGEPLKGHQGVVRSVAISNDGKTIISAGKDGTVRLWTIEGKPIFEPFKGHKDMVRSATISNDGKTIISGGDDGTVRLWTREGKQIGEFKGHQGSIVRSVAISSDGKSIISGGEDGTLHIWNREGKLIDTPFKGHQGWVTSVAISIDGKTIISGGEDGTVRLWNIKNKTIGKSFKAYSDVMSVTVSNDKKSIISGGADGYVRLWTKEGKPIGKPFKSDNGWVRSVAISTDGKTIVSGGADGYVRLWNKEGKQIGKPLKGHKGMVRSVAISTDGNTIISGGEDGYVRLWTKEGKQIGKPFKSHQREVWSVGISTDGETIISSGADGYIGLWTREGQPIGKPFKGHEGTMVWSVGISTDGKTIVSGGDDGYVRLWTRDGKTIGEPFKGHQGRVWTVTISTDNKTIISGGNDGTVRLWTLEGKSIGQPFKVHQGEVYSVAISTDSKTIISGGKDGTVNIWDISLEYWLKMACEQLRGHSALTGEVKKNCKQ